MRHAIYLELQKHYYKVRIPSFRVFVDLCAKYSIQGLQEARLSRSIAALYNNNVTVEVYPPCFFLSVRQEENLLESYIFHTS